MRTFAGVVVALAALAGGARADDKDRADKLFKQGKKLLAEKRYADACQAFEDSAKLDPGIGVELNVALCFEEWGRLARAYRSYEAALRMATDASDAREPRIRERMQKLDATVPRLTLRAPDGAAADAVITLDGKPFDAAQLGKPQLVDPGPHSIEYVVGDQRKTKVIPIERGASSEVVLDLPARARGGGEPAARERAATPATPGRGQRIAAYATAGVGVAAIGVSIGVAVAAKSAYGNALTQHCAGSTTMCDPTGLQETHDARKHANIATGVFVGGAVAVAVGAVLYLTAPRGRPHDERAVYLAPALGDGGGLVLGGSF